MKIQYSINKYKKELLNKKQLLDNAVKQLKKEFVGIDNVIEQIADATESWILFPEMQEKPVIINLWGLTGIGKTSLVKRFSELINYKERYYRFDLGESSNKYYDIQDSFRDIYDNCDKEPFIIGLDEFQLARTINEKMEEIDKSSSRVIWDLLDNGKFDILDFNYNMNAFSKLIKKLDKALAMGVNVEKGKVISNIEAYHEIFSDIFEPFATNTNDIETTDNHNLNFIPEESLNTIFYVCNNVFLTKSELQNKLKEFNGIEIIDYLIKLYKKLLKPKTVNCSKSLVFVMGNIDEIYSMTYDFNPDMNADDFHKQSLKITITQLKKALLHRFRSEQIARLGNIHIIYPTFNKKSFYQIINIELEKIKKKVLKNYNINISFDKSIEELIFNEGVYPTQGTRPLYTTINQIINARLGKILSEIYLNNFEIDSIYFTKNEELSTKDIASLKVDFLQKGIIKHYILHYQSLTLGKLRKEKLNDEQAIVAVHESGHAVLSAVLLKTIPDSIFSVTADSTSLGFVFSNPKWNYISKKEIINRLAILFGGIIAEKIVFGEENITFGASSDLEAATKFVMNALYSCGMGKSLGTFGSRNKDITPDYLYDDNIEDKGINSEAKQILLEAEKLAESTLLKQKKLLIKLSDYLSDKTTISKELMLNFVEKYSVDFIKNDIIENADNLFYRNHLKKIANNI